MCVYVWYVCMYVWVDGCGEVGESVWGVGAFASVRDCLPRESNRGEKKWEGRNGSVHTVIAGTAEAKGRERRKGMVRERVVR